MDVDPLTPLRIDRIVRKACQELARIVRHNDDDNRIGQSVEIVWAIVHEALKQDPDIRKHLASEVEYRANIEKIGEKEFIAFLRELAETDSWQELLEHRVFLKKQDPVQWDLVNPYAVYATMRSWNAEFKGKAAGVLLVTISDYLDRGKVVYARAAPIINSSGTGKSRMVDDLSKEIITIPICLRGHDSGGFPPPDANIRDWLLIHANLRSQDRSAKQLYAFVYSLLCVTLEHLKSIDVGDIREHGKERQRALASAFRDLMTNGQSFESPGTDRVEFYNQVIIRAKEFMNEWKRDPQEGTTSSPTLRYVAGISEAGEELCKFVDPSGVMDANVGPRRPLIIISFDEAHKLAGELRGRMWTLFSELHRVLRGLANLPIFTLFLSTSGKSVQFSPESHSDPSNRISNSIFRVLHPIPEISFDDIVLPSTDGVNLDRVVQMDWISHLGRPLFGTRYDAMPRDIKDKDAMLFAEHKLLNGQKPRDYNKAGILACLLVRFGLELKTENADFRDMALTQVERHMRLCLAATSRFRHLVTISGSEPLLAEAADQFMRKITGSPVYHLRSRSDCIDHGRRGELIAALIIMQARDEAAHAAHRRWITVSEFMEALLPTAAHGELQQSLPTIWREGENKTFNETFKNYGMWFNHVIKVEDGEMISANHLWKFIKRGAMVVCKDDHYGIDIVLPACDVNDTLSPDNVTAILVQVRNDKKIKDKIQSGLFNAMDPFVVGLFEDEQSPRPIIRLVFALASPTAAVLIPGPPTCKNRFEHFTAFDVWCAGLSEDTFRYIEEIGLYKNLLERLPKPLDVFDLEEMDDWHLPGEETKTNREYQRRKMAALGTSLDGSLGEETKTE